MSDQPPFTFTSARPKTDAEAEAQKGGDAPRTVANPATARTRTSAKTVASSRRGPPTVSRDAFIKIITVLDECDDETRWRVLQALAILYVDERG